MVGRFDETVVRRLDAIINTALAAFEGGRGLSSATKGSEREIFLKSILESVFPPTFRFGSGDIIDADARQSGQLDIVVEVPTMFSLPITKETPRLYFADGVAAAIEVKSNLANQWDQVKETAEKLLKLRRVYERQLLIAELNRCRQHLKQLTEIGIEVVGQDQGKTVQLSAEEKAKAIKEYEIDLKAQAEQLAKQVSLMPPDPPPTIPLYVVGFEGWKDRNAFQDKIDSLNLAGGLILQNRIYCSGAWRTSDPPGRVVVSYDGSAGALLGFMANLAFDLQVVTEFPNPLKRYLA